MNNPHIVNQKGGAVLLAVILLLVMVTLVTLYTGKIQSFEHQILLNSQNQKKALYAAEAGLQRGFSLLRINKEWQSSDVFNETLTDKSQFSLYGKTEGVVGPQSTRKVITLTSTGYSPDRLAVAEVTEQALIYPLLVNIPASPLMVKGGFNQSADFEIVANEHGRGKATPLSVLSNKRINLQGTQSHTCLKVHFDAGKCASQAISSSVLKGQDISDLSAFFPPDLLAYLFSIPINQWTMLKEQADFILTSCDSLEAASSGLFWIMGDCEISLGRKVATQQQPIILVINDGNLILRKKSLINGLVLSFQQPGSSNTSSVYMEIGANINGALVSNHVLGRDKETTRVIYEERVLETLTRLPGLHRVARIPGSWSDF